MLSLIPFEWPILRKRREFISRAIAPLQNGAETRPFDRLLAIEAQ